MAGTDWRSSFEVWTSNGTYAHPDSPAGGTGTGFSRLPGGGHAWSRWPSQLPHPDSRAGRLVDWSSRVLDCGLGPFSYSMTYKAIHWGPQIALRFACEAAAEAKDGRLEGRADDLGKVSFRLNVVGAGFVLAGPLTGFSTAVIGEGMGLGAGFVDLGAGVLYLVDAAARGNRRSLWKGAFSFGSVLLDAGTADIGAVYVKGAHGGKQFAFKSTKAYISFRVGADRVIYQFLQGEFVKRGTDLLVKYVKPG